MDCFATVIARPKAEAIHPSLRGTKQSTSAQCNCATWIAAAYGLAMTKPVSLRGTKQSSHINASSPFRSSKLKSLSDGPLGCLPPCSHWRTADRLVLSKDANTDWLS